MKRITYLSIFLIALLFSAEAFCDSDLSSRSWKAGVAKRIITPEGSMWMAGYAARVNPSQGTLHDLWAKALALEDADGNQALLICTEILGYNKILSDQICERLELNYGLSRDRIILNSTHTHSGPVLKDALYDIYPLEEKHIADIEKYTLKLADQLVALAGDALKNMKEARIYSQNGVTRFQVNRRNNDPGNLDSQTQLEGPNDFAVPVLKIVDHQGDLMAVAFGYACHPTVLDAYQWCGDYPGFAQIELEKIYPGSTAMFFMGAGADQDPLPRHTVALARQYGKELAAAVERVLEEEMQELLPSLSVSYSEIELPLNPPMSLHELHEITRDTLAHASYQIRWAERMIEERKLGKVGRTSYPYPLQVWLLGQQMLVNMGGEVVVEYANKLKEFYGKELFVMAYSNDVMAYIPSTTILEEGGYEGLVSQQVYGLPNTWKPGIESLILKEITRLVELVGAVKASGLP